MAQQTATEKDMFVQQLQREAQTTVKVLKALPADQSNYKPHEKSRTAKELARTFTMEQGVVDMALKGKIDFSQPTPPPPADYSAAIAAFESAVKDTAAKVTSTSESDLNRFIQFPIGPGKMGDFRVIDVLWTTLMDQVHHRGQFSVYLRLAGGMVPSIYGPTADEPWL